MTEKDLRGSESGISDSVRNDFKQDEEMNLTLAKREKIVITETEVKEQNIKQEEDDLVTETEVIEQNIKPEDDDLVTGLKELGIKGKINSFKPGDGLVDDPDLKAHGPTGGVPVNNCQHQLEKRHTHFVPPLMPQYAYPPNYQQQTNNPAQQRRRRLEEPEQTSFKFRATTNVHMQNMLQQPKPVHNIIQPDPVLYHPTQIQSQTQISTPVNVGYNVSKLHDYMEHSFPDKHNRREWDPIYNKMESACKQSPFSDSVSSHDRTLYTLPPSVDSGYRSPRNQALSLDGTRNSQGCVGGSSAKCTAPFMPSKPEIYPDTSYPRAGPSQVSSIMKCDTAVQDPLVNQCSGESSKYIDEHLDILHDALNVIANDIMFDAQKKAAKKQACQQEILDSDGNPSNVVASTQKQESLSLNAVPATAFVQDTPVATAVATLVSHAQQPGVVAQSHPTTVTAGSQVVLLPAGIALLSQQGKQTSQPPAYKELRKILPKMPVGTQNRPHLSRV